MDKQKMQDIGLLVLRVGIGAMFMFHGIPKILSGPVAWEGIGKAMGVFGITVAPMFWGFMAALSEAVGGLLILLGVLVRPACLFLVITMAVAAGMHLSQGDGLMGASHAIEDGIVFLSLLLIGPGNCTIMKLFKRS
jgi:putative oxidoreductase